MNYKFRELLEFRISIKSYEYANKVGPTPVVLTLE